LQDVVVVAMVDGRSKWVIVTRGPFKSEEDKPTSRVVIGC
jgi:hypothetical protein